MLLCSSASLKIVLHLLHILLFLAEEIDLSNFLEPGMFMDNNIIIIGFMGNKSMGRYVVYGKSAK